ncbi:MAG: hypothetical protein EKK57_02285 [Proteobacteria bacterium]|nr:MAG: hypothetical protein EKK57_02285 [Pseudomonadota bacterium]
MYSEFYCEQKELLAVVEKRLDEIKSVEITNETIANDMIEEYQYLTNYVKNIAKCANDIKGLSNEILTDYKNLKDYLVTKQKQLKGDKKCLV